VKQNCSEVDKLIQATQLDLQHQWNIAPSALFNEDQQAARRGGSKHHWYNRLYDVTTHEVFEDCPQDDWDAPVGPQGGDPDELERPAIEDKPQQRALGDKAFSVAVPKDEQRLLAEYVLASLPRYSYFAVMVERNVHGKDEVEFFVYQVLAQECSDVLAATFADDHSSKWTWNVQKMEYWQDPEFINRRKLPSRVMAFTLAEPEYVSVFSIFGHVPEGRTLVTKLDVAPSDPDMMRGTICLVNAGPLAWRHCRG
jgi:hypothetical protein